MQSPMNPSRLPCSVRTGLVIAGCMATMAGCHSDEREVIVQVVPTTGFAFQSPGGHSVMLEAAELELHSLDLLAPDTTAAWLAPLAGSVAYAHGVEAGGRVGTLAELGIVALDEPREVGRLDLAADAFVGADLMLGTATRFAGTVDGVPFAVELGEQATVQVTGSAEAEGVVEILVDLPAIFADLVIDDDNQDGVLDGADTVFTNTVAFGVVSSRTYAVRSPDSERAGVLAAEGDVVAGEASYSAACASCHGADAQGGVGPGLQGHVAGAPRADTLDVVLNGLGTMNAIDGLEARALADCIAYLHYREW